MSVNMMHPSRVHKSSELKRPGSLRPPLKLDLMLDGTSCDRLLVQRAKLGEHGAFNALVSKYRDRVMKLSMRYTRNRDDAEDAVQNTFIYAYSGLPHFRGESAFYSWLHRIAINTAKNVLSARTRHASVFVASSGDGDDANGNPMSLKNLDTPEELAVTEEICSAVNECIEELCEEQRTAIVLRELEGMSYSQVAFALSCPVGTVRSRVYRAREAIDKRLRHVFDAGLGRTKSPVSLRALQLPETSVDEPATIE